MKKKNVINLVKYYMEKNDSGFRQEAYEVAKEFDASGDYQLAEYVMALLSDVNAFVPQSLESKLNYFEKIDGQEDMLFLPDEITQDLLGVVNAIERNIGVSKFLFAGSPGTGKTEAVKQLARILARDVYMVNFSLVIDSKLGQTQKNMAEMFKEINGFINKDKVIVLFDEIDAIALDRTNENDHREMGRATSAFLRCLDQMDENIVLIATTNLYKHFDKALVRRFDTVIDFDRYSEEDILEVAERVMDRYLESVRLGNRDVRLFRKIIKLSKERRYPGELKNMIKTAIAFSDVDDGNDYFRRLYYAICGEKPTDLKGLQQQGFTVREIEILSKKSKSAVARELKE